MIYLLLEPAVQSSRLMLIFGITLLISLVSFASAQGQRRAGAQAGADEARPAFQEYRGVQLGMTADEVRRKLGSPKDKSDEQDFFIFNETETAQIVYDKLHKVITISADFMTSGNGVPTAKQVLGADLQAKPDGSIYKMVRYPKAGCWLSYNRTAGSSPLTTVTIQKIEQ